MCHYKRCTKSAIQSRCAITSDVHSLQSNSEPLFPAWFYPKIIFKISISMGCKVFEHLFSLNSLIFFLLWLTDKKICGEKNSEMSSTGLLSHRYKRILVLCRIWWFDFSIPIVISDVSLQPICTGYSDILYVFFFRFWFWFLSSLS